MKKFNHQICNWDSQTSIVVTSDDGNASCGVHVFDTEKNVAVVSDLYVQESCRNKGYATAMLDYCVEIAKSQGCNEILLRSDNDDWVREWYMRKGFVIHSSQVWLKKDI